MNSFVLPIESERGTFYARYTETGLAEIDFPNKRKRSISSTETVPAKIRQWHAQTTKVIAATLAGKSTPAMPPLDLSGTDFQKRVWSELQKVAVGETVSYGELAATLGKPNAARAVGAACGANPVPVIVPCHRVLASNRTLGGFSGGLEWKKALLAAEQVEFKLR